MNPRILIRQSSFGPIKRKSDQYESSPYLKPDSTQNLLVLKPQSIKVRRRKRLHTLNPNELPKLQNDCENSKSVNVSPLDLSERSFDSQENLIQEYSQDLLFEKLEEKIKNLEPNNYQAKFDAYFAIFDLIIIADRPFSKILGVIKEGITENLTMIYESKLTRLNNQIFQYKENYEKLKCEKETLLSKLSFLSSENINLINANEILVEKCLNFEKSIKIYDDKKGSSFAFIDELQKKSTKIKELSLKLEEMYKNEAKIMKIIEKFKEHGLDFEKMYGETIVSCKDFERKHKKTVPALKINILKEKDI